MKAISSSSFFQLPRVCGGGGRNSGGDARLYGYCGGSSSSSSKIVAKKSKGKQPRPPQDSKPPPPRITSNLKQNLQILRYLKEHQKRKSTTPKPATSYRRKKVVKEDLPEETELSHDPTMTFDLKDEDIEGAAEVLLVDGYNVCGYWPKLKKDFMNGRLDIARQNLIDELVTYSGMRDMKVVVVFDATMSGQRTHKETFFGIDVVYSAETCADTWIEKEVALLRQEGCPSVLVATSDRYEQEAVFGEGAWVWSCKELISEIEDSHKEIERSIKKRPTSMEGRLLKYNLDPKIVDALKDLRNKLAEKELRRR